MAAEHGATVDVLHVVDDSLPPTLCARQIEAAGAALRDQLAALSSPGVTLASQVVSGEAFAEVVRHADESGASLIVLGTHRHSTRALFRGTTAERIMRLGHLPVLVVRDPVAHRYARILVGFDLSPHARRALEIVVALAPDAQILLVHAAHVPFRGLAETATVLDVEHREKRELRRTVEHDLRELSERTGRPAPRWELIVREGSPEGVISAQAERFRPDLIAVGTHGRTGAANLILGSVAETILADAPTDVLAVKAW